MKPNKDIDTDEAINDGKAAIKTLSKKHICLWCKQKKVNSTTLICKDCINEQIERNQRHNRQLNNTNTNI